MVEFKGVVGNNLKNVDLFIFVGLFICVMGVLGLGKFILINDIFFKIVYIVFNGVMMVIFVFYCFI